MLFPMRSGLAFVERPPLFLPAAAWDGVALGRVAGTNQTFDLVVSGVEFAMISRDEMPGLQEYVAGRCVARMPRSGMRVVLAATEILTSAGEPGHACRGCCADAARARARRRTRMLAKRASKAAAAVGGSGGEGAGAVKAEGDAAGAAAAPAAAGAAAADDSSSDEEDEDFAVSDGAGDSGGSGSDSGSDEEGSGEEEEEAAAGGKAAGKARAAASGSDSDDGQWGIRPAEPTPKKARAE
jgi:hypothetical protein